MNRTKQGRKADQWSRGGSQVRAMLGLGLCLGLLTILGGCTPGRLRPSYENHDGSQGMGSNAAARGLPWDGETLTWRKLDLIQGWLSSEEATRRPEWRNEARLELAEGRMRLARSEANSVSTATIKERVDSARRGFRLVRTDHKATRSERRRADHGLDDLLDFQRTGFGVRGHTAEANSRPKAAPRAGATNKAVSATSNQQAIIPRASWNARKAILGRLNRERGWRRITIHHSANHTNELGGQSLPTVKDAVRRIQRTHIEGRDWGDIGYHFLIDPQGRVFEGRKASYQGAHAGDGASNLNNAGICLLGHFDQEQPTAAALNSLEGLIDTIRTQNRIPRSQVFSHQDFKETECPGRFLLNWLNAYSKK